MHALVGQRHLEAAGRATGQRLGQRIALLAIKLRACGEYVRAKWPCSMNSATTACCSVAGCRSIR